MAAKRRRRRRRRSILGIVIKTFLIMVLLMCLGIVGVFYFGGYYDEVRGHQAVEG